MYSCKGQEKKGTWLDARCFRPEAKCLLHRPFPLLQFLPHLSLPLIVLSSACVSGSTTHISPLEEGPHWHKRRTRALWLLSSLSFSSFFCSQNTRGLSYTARHVPNSCMLYLSQLHRRAFRLSHYRDESTTKLHRSNCVYLFPRCSMPTSEGYRFVNTKVYATMYSCFTYVDFEFTVAFSR